MKGYFSEEALLHFSELASQTQAANFSEGEIYDFTRCVRPNGSAYGTNGKCRKGVEGEKEIAAKTSKTPKAPAEHNKVASEPVKEKSSESPPVEKTLDELEKAWSDKQKEMMALLLAGKKEEGKVMQEEVGRLRGIYQTALAKETGPPAWFLKPEKLNKEMREEAKLEARQTKYDRRQEKAESKLTGDERKALLDYTHDAKKGPRSYQNINKCLRQNKCFGEESRQVIADLDSAVAKLPKNTDGDPFYRRVFSGNAAAKELYKTLENAKPGTKFTDPGFGSYSSDKQITEELATGSSNFPILFVSRNKKLTPINTFSGMEREKEALLPRGITQTILSVKKEGNELIVELD